MPYKTVFINAELFFSYRDIDVYHTYEHDEIEQGENRYWFTLDSESAEDERIDFDPRDFPNSVVNEHTKPPFLCGEPFESMSATGKAYTGAAWKCWHIKHDLKIKQALRNAIDDDEFLATLGDEIYTKHRSAKQ